MKRTTPALPADSTAGMAPSTAAAAAEDGVSKKRMRMDVLESRLKELDEETHDLRNKLSDANDGVKITTLYSLLAKVEVREAETKLEFAKLDDDLYSDNELRPRRADQMRLSAERRVEYARRRATYADTEKKIAEAKAEMSDATDEDMRSIARKNWLTLNENLAREEVAVKEAMMKMFPDPIGPKPLVTKTWEEVSGIISAIPFSQNELLSCEEYGHMVLGSLYKPGVDWPIVNLKSGVFIDMRLAPRRLIDPDATDELRPAARVLSDKIINSETGSFALIAVPGAGKSSGLIDLGRGHFVIFIQSSASQEPPNRGAMARKSRELDQNFVNLYVDVEKITTNGDTLPETKDNWNKGIRRCEIEMVARTLQLVLLYRKMGAMLTPWQFAVHQLAGEQQAVVEIVRTLSVLDDNSIRNVLTGAMNELAPLFTNTCKFVVAIDEMELATHLLLNRFVTNDPLDNSRSPKGLLSPLVRAIGNLTYIARWSIVLAGIGTSEKSVQRLKPNIGKLSMNCLITDASAFPLTKEADVVHVLTSLNISAELEGMLKSGLVPTPLHERERESSSTVEQIKFKCEEYLLPVRFRVLCATVEHVLNALSTHKAGDDLLLEAMEISISEHVTGILDRLQVRLDKNHEFGLHEFDVDDYLDLLLQVTVAMKLTNGETGILFDVKSNINDLTRLGIAAASLTEPEDRKVTPSYWYTSYTVCERFVLNALEAFFARGDGIARIKAFDARSKVALRTLAKVINMFGSQSSFKGNLVERIILDRLVRLQSKCPNVKDLPFFPADGATDVSWNEFEFNPQRVEQYSGARSSVEFLRSRAAEQVIFAPEPVCRPDSIVMLRAGENQPRRALSLGIAVYTKRVPKSKVENQFWSTDLSRAYLNDNHVAYPATQDRRQAWVDAGLHTTVALRVHVCLPRAPAARGFAWQIYEREATVNGSQTLKPLQSRGAVASEHQDLIVNIDQSNIHLLLGDPRTEVGEAKEALEDLYKLLKLATGVRDGWTCSSETMVLW